MTLNGRRLTLQKILLMFKFMKKALKRPTIFQLSIGLIISIVQSLVWKKTIMTPKVIGKYRLVREIGKENPFRSYGLGQYQYKKEKVFIKTWNGLVKDFEYFELVSEYLVSKALYSKFRSQRYIKVPNAFSFVNNKDFFSIIYEFIDGKPLYSFSSKKQIEILCKLLFFLKRYRATSMSKEDWCISKRTLKHYILSFTFLCILTVLSDLKSFKVVIRGYIDSIKHIKFVKNNSLKIAHRDLNLHNIIVKGKYIFLIDCARVIFTYEDYDIAHISANPKLKNIAKDIARDFNYSQNIFLENYILINQARSFGNPIGFKNFYLEELRRRYG